jgi:hypothetical protein
MEVRRKGKYGCDQQAGFFPFREGAAQRGNLLQVSFIFSTPIEMAIKEHKSSTFKISQPPQAESPYWICT